MATQTQSSAKDMCPSSAMPTKTDETSVPDNHQRPTNQAKPLLCTRLPKRLLISLEGTPSLSEGEGSDKKLVWQEIALDFSMGSVSHFLPRNPRPRLLHNWGASLLTIAQKTYQQAEHFHGPVGYITRTLASNTTCIVNPVQRQWLSILSFIDDQILSVEDITMTVFPPSSHLFSMVDELALLAESFPKRYDAAIHALSSLIQHLPLFNQVLKPMLSVIGSWEWSDRDEEVMVDIHCEEQEKKVLTPKGGGEDRKKSDMVMLEKLDAGDEKKLNKEEAEIEEVEKACKDIIRELEKMGMVDGGDKDGERNRGEKVGKKNDELLLLEEEEEEEEGQGVENINTLLSF